MWAFCNVLAGFAYRSCSAPSSLMVADSRYVIHFRFGTDQKSEGKEPVFSREHCGSYFSFSFQSYFVLHVFWVQSPPWDWHQAMMLRCSATFSASWRRGDKASPCRISGTAGMGFASENRRNSMDWSWSWSSKWLEFYIQYI